MMIMMLLMMMIEMMLLLLLLFSPLMCARVRWGVCMYIINCPSCLVKQHEISNDLEPCLSTGGSMFTSTSSRVCTYDCHLSDTSHGIAPT